MPNHIFELSDTVSRQSVSYRTRYGIKVSAELYLPKDHDEAGAYPALIVGAPYGGVKEQGPGIYANEMAQRGYAVLTFDPSFNGDSAGDTRHLSSPDVFVEDISAAVDFMGTRPFVDRERIGVIGICGSGSFGLSAAQVDTRIKAVATVSMYDISRYHEKGFADTLTDAERQGWLQAIANQRYADFESGTAALSERGSPLEIDEDTHPIGREFGEFYSRPRGYHPNSITQFTQTSAASFINFALLNKIGWISPRPILFVIGENAHSRYFSEDAYERAGDAKELFIVPGAGHVDLYDKVDLIPFAKLDDFFQTHLEG
ncbi:alpha/beta hydrolase [Maricaulis parjimensis]|uniref:alpha/beta hydrolase n=1 Tax=Maricaulis parjimensis TaxID=144023 RepID=UPI00193A53D4|nr:alpha/beta hydrolase [Maricaulis parjimensis]